MDESGREIRLLARYRRSSTVAAAVLVAAVAGPCAVAAGPTGDSRGSAVGADVDDAMLRDLVSRAPAIALGTVTGVALPGLHAGDPPNAYWVRIQRTLKGPDEAGAVLRVSPERIHWQAGADYVFFLKTWGMDWGVSIPPALSASRANTDAVTQAVEAAGAGVQPRRVLWLTRCNHSTGSGNIEIWVNADGGFRWHRGVDWFGHQPALPDEILVGKLPATKRAALIEAAAQTGGGYDTMARDVTVVCGRWLDSKGAIRHRKWESTGNRPIDRFMKALEDTVRSIGHPPEQTATPG